MFRNIHSTKRATSSLDSLGPRVSAIGRSPPECRAREREPHFAGYPYLPSEVHVQNPFPPQNSEAKKTVDDVFEVYLNPQHKKSSSLVEFVTYIYLI